MNTQRGGVDPGLAALIAALVSGSVIGVGYIKEGDKDKDNAKAELEKEYGQKLADAAKAEAENESLKTQERTSREKIAALMKERDEAQQRLKDVNAKIDAESGPALTFKTATPQALKDAIPKVLQALGARYPHLTTKDGTRRIIEALEYPTTYQAKLERLTLPMFYTKRLQVVFQQIANKPTGGRRRYRRRGGAGDYLDKQIRQQRKLEKKEKKRKNALPAPVVSAADEARAEQFFNEDEAPSPSPEAEPVPAPAMTAPDMAAPAMTAPESSIPSYNEFAAIYEDAIRNSTVSVKDAVEKRSADARAAVDGRVQGKKDKAANKAAELLAYKLDKVVQQAEKDIASQDPVVTALAPARQTVLQTMKSDLQSKIMEARQMYTSQPPVRAEMRGGGSMTEQAEYAAAVYNEDTATGPLPPLRAVKTETDWKSIEAPAKALLESIPAAVKAYVEAVKVAKKENDADAKVAKKQADMDAKVAKKQGDMDAKAAAAAAAAAAKAEKDRVDADTKAKKEAEAMAVIFEDLIRKAEALLAQPIPTTPESAPDTNERLTKKVAEVREVVGVPIGPLVAPPMAPPNKKKGWFRGGGDENLRSVETAADWKELNKNVKLATLREEIEELVNTYSQYVKPAPEAPKNQPDSINKGVRADVPRQIAMIEDTLKALRIKRQTLGEDIGEIAGSPTQYIGGCGLTRVLGPDVLQLLDGQIKALTDDRDQIKTAFESFKTTVGNGYVDNKSFELTQPEKDAEERKKKEQEATKQELDKIFEEVKKALEDEAKNAAEAEAATKAEKAAEAKKRQEEAAKKEEEAEELFAELMRQKEAAKLKAVTNGLKRATEAKRKENEAAADAARLAEKPEQERAGRLMLGGAFASFVAVLSDVNDASAQAADDIAQAKVALKRAESLEKTIVRVRNNPVATAAQRTIEEQGCQILLAQRARAAEAVMANRPIPGPPSTPPPPLPSAPLPPPPPPVLETLKVAADGTFVGPVNPLVAQRLANRKPKETGIEMPAVTKKETPPTRAELQGFLDIVKSGTPEQVKAAVDGGMPLTGYSGLIGVRDDSVATYVVRQLTTEAVHIPNKDERIQEFKRLIKILRYFMLKPFEIRRQEVERMLNNLMDKYAFGMARQERDVMGAMAEARRLVRRGPAPPDGPGNWLKLEFGSSVPYQSIRDEEKLAGWSIEKTAPLPAEERSETTTPDPGSTSTTPRVVEENKAKLEAAQAELKEVQAQLAELRRTRPQFANTADGIEQKFAFDKSIAAVEYRQDDLQREIEDLQRPVAAAGVGPPPAQLAPPDQGMNVAKRLKEPMEAAQALAALNAEEAKRKAAAEAEAAAARAGPFTAAALPDVVGQYTTNRRRPGQPQTTEAPAARFVRAASTRFGGGKKTRRKGRKGGRKGSRKSTLKKRRGGK
jgi:hypothetical protein